MQTCFYRGLPPFEFHRNSGATSEECCQVCNLGPSPNVFWKSKWQVFKVVDRYWPWNFIKKSGSIPRRFFLPRFSGNENIINVSELRRNNFVAQNKRNVSSDTREPRLRTADEQLHRKIYRVHTFSHRLYQVDKVSRISGAAIILCASQ